MRRDHTFTALGSEVRLMVDGGSAALLRCAQHWIRTAHEALTRFDGRSELCALNADPRAEVPASRLLRDAVAAAVLTARRTSGLVDPTLQPEMEAAGYRRTLSELPRLAVADALAAAPARAPARARRNSAWQAIAVDDARGTIRRPCGTRLDLGGSAKGLIADIVALRLAEHAESVVVDCGGDLRVAGRGVKSVAVEHPLTGELVHTVPLHGGAAATSGLARRVWQTAGGPAHHLLDPSTGRPAWTGLAGATALAPTALEAEALAKAAFLSGPAGARRQLARHGGLLHHEDGTTEPVPASGQRRLAPLSTPGQRRLAPLSRDEVRS